VLTGDGQRLSKCGLRLGSVARRLCQRIFARLAKVSASCSCETKCSDWFALVVANPELCKDGFGYVHFIWCK
jgi:hypothetical protein